MNKKPSAKGKRVRAKPRAKPKKSAQTSAKPHSYSPTLGDIDLHLFAEGRHERIYEKLGAHLLTLDTVEGVTFAVWAPNAERVTVVGTFNDWDGTKHPMRLLGGSGVWELFIPGLKAGELYKYEIKSQLAPRFLKADPYAAFAEVPPNTSSVVYESKYRFRDSAWVKKRANVEYFRRPMSIYELHFGSWRRVVDE